MCLTQTPKDIDPNVDVRYEERYANTSNVMISVRVESNGKEINRLTAKQEKIAHVLRKRRRKAETTLTT